MNQKNQENQIIAHPVFREITVQDGFFILTLSPIPFSLLLSPFSFLLFSLLQGLYSSYSPETFFALPFFGLLFLPG